MSFVAKVKIDGEEMNVLHCGYRFSQATDANGRPTAIPRGGTIHLTIESTGGTELFDWMISHTQTKSGVITFYRRDTNSKLKTLEFSEGHCVDYYETFDSVNDSPMQVQLTISAHSVKLNDAEFINNWPES